VGDGLTSRQRESLLQVIGRAAPPAERATGRFFAPLPDQDQALIARREALWIQAVAGRAPERFAELLAERGLIPAAFRLGLPEVTLRNPTSLPSWGQALVDLLDGAARDDPKGAEAAAAVAPPLGEFFAPLLRSAAHHLTDHLAATGQAATGEVQSQILATLAARFWRDAGQVLDHDSALAAATAGFLGRFGATATQRPDLTVDGWLDRLARFPALAYVLGVTYRDWRDFVSELFDRLATDADLLRQRLFAGEAPGQLTQFKGDTGDVHGHGRAVAILGFESGRGVVYKPKDLRIGAGFMGLVAFLNDAGLPVPLHVRSILPRDGYAWEDFVEPAPCRDAGDVERFYLRMGMTIRLLQFLEGRDFWLDNLIARGEHPVFIDLETLLQPRIQAPNLLPAEREAADRLEGSVVKTCAVVMGTPIALGIAAEDLGALATPREFLAPFTRERRPMAGSGDRSPDASDYVTWTHPEHAPTLDGRPADAADHLCRIIDGYRAMQTCLAANRDALQAPEGPLAPLREAPVRFIYRDTWSCLRIVQRSLAPALLADPIGREIFLQRLLGAVLTEDLDEAARARHARIIAAEIAAFRDLDVPFFVHHPDGGALQTVDGEEIEGFFAGSAWARLRARVAGLDRFPLGEQIDLLRSCFATGHPRRGRPVPSITLEGERVCVAAAPTGASWLEAAVAIGEAILAEAVATPTGDMAWPGLAFHPNIDLAAVEVLRPDLLSGTCGPAILFAELYAATGDERWRQATHGALAATLKAVADAPLTWRDLTDPAAAARAIPPASGAFYGVGAHVYTLRRCARALAAPDLDAAATAYLDRLPLAALVAGAPFDVVSGTTGLLLALLAPGRERPAAATVDLAVELAIGVLEARTPTGDLPAPPYPPRLTALDGLPDAAAGLAIGLARLARLVSEPLATRFRNEIGRLQTGPLARDGKAPATVGRLLTGLELVRLGCGEPELCRASVDAYLDGIDERAEDCPVSVFLDALEVALGASESSGEPRYRQRAHAFGMLVREHQRTTGVWLPDSFAADRHQLSAVWGLPAIALAFLRLHDAAAVHSLRLLA
jgi:type 2 lantibiotic biosynthesis protein LanM